MADGPRQAVLVRLRYSFSQSPDSLCVTRATRPHSERVSTLSVAIVYVRPDQRARLEVLRLPFWLTEKTGSEIYILPTLNESPNVVLRFVKLVHNPKGLARVENLARPSDSADEKIPITTLPDCLEEPHPQP